MALSKTVLLVTLAFAVLLISAEVSAHRDLVEATNQNSKPDRFHGNDHGHGGHRNGEHGGHGNGGHGGHGGQGGHGGHGGHGPDPLETETEN